MQYEIGTFLRPHSYFGRQTSPGGYSMVNRALCIVSCELVNYEFGEL